MVEERAWLEQARWLIDLRRSQDESAVQRGIGLLALQGVLISIIAPSIVDLPEGVARWFAASAELILVLALVFALAIVVARPMPTPSMSKYTSDWTSFAASGKRSTSIEARFAQEILGLNGLRESWLTAATESVHRRNQAQRLSVSLTFVGVTVFMGVQLGVAL